MDRCTGDIRLLPPKTQRSGRFKQCSRPYPDRVLNQRLASFAADGSERCVKNADTEPVPSACRRCAALRLVVPDRGGAARSRCLPGALPYWPYAACLPNSTWPAAAATPSTSPSPSPSPSPSTLAASSPTCRLVPTIVVRCGPPGADCSASSTPRHRPASAPAGCRGSSPINWPQDSRWHDRHKPSAHGLRLDLHWPFA